jgi:hypothetical protein
MTGLQKSAFMLASCVPFASVLWFHYGVKKN